MDFEFTIQTLQLYISIFMVQYDSAETEERKQLLRSRMIEVKAAIAKLKRSDPVVCERCKLVPATTKYSSMNVCQFCCDRLDDEFDNEMS